MATVKVSPKYQVVIPQSVRDVIDLRPGQEVEIMLYEGRIEMIPIRPLKEMRGFLRGINTEIEREDDRE